MGLISLLIGIPAVMAVIMAVMRNEKVRGIVVYIGAGAMMAVTLAFVIAWAVNITQTGTYFIYTEGIDHVMTVCDIFLMCLIVYLSAKYKRFFPALLSIVQTVMLLYVEFCVPVNDGPHIMIDNLAILMCIIAAFVGGFICIYTVGYMKCYHEHHKEYKDRRPFFFSMLFLFLAAMFGLVLSENLIWIYFFWEITSVISFLLIGYTKTEEAVDNSFTALWMNLLGGLGFSIAIFYLAVTQGSLQLTDCIAKGSLLPLACLALAGLTKSAQMPFSTWLFGAMVAPTPSSALLHSATMVKAGVYLLIRLAPAMSGTLVGTIVAFIGGLTFILTSFMAIAQNDAKKVLAFSTISNLGLIVACAGIGVEETVWAAIFLMIFHAVCKSMLFQSVGATENSIGSRDIEAMHGLLLKIPKLAYIMGIGIVGMYLAPFGMLISKWVALKAFVDSGNILLVIFIAYGSATTMFYWTKWLAKLNSRHASREKVTDVTRKDEYASMFVHAGIMVIMCLALPFIALYVVDPLVARMFGNVQEVLSMGALATMALMLISILLVPTIMLFVSRSAKKKHVPIYMNGINCGDNTHFVDSFGEERHLYLSNWYLRFEFGRRHLLKPSQIISAAVLIVMFCMIIGGIA
jgi:NADH:ubiquinone oxidoreductase subunit 5 (subunit L)/multisubunit Na+/H+ antiporter MnhA subunit